MPTDPRAGPQPCDSFPRSDAAGDGAQGRGGAMDALGTVQRAVRSGEGQNFLLYRVDIFITGVARVETHPPTHGEDPRFGCHLEREEFSKKKAQKGRRNKRGEIERGSA